MNYPKLLSQKSLDKMYAEAKIGPEKLDFLRTFFVACANLYGRIPLSHAWVVYKELCKKTVVPNIQLKDILSFSSIARREEHPYYIFEVDRCNIDYIKTEVAKRPSKLKNIIGRIIKKPAPYKNLESDLKYWAKVHNVSISELRDPKIVYPEKIEW